jgi:hypothetical protein
MPTRSDRPSVAGSPAIELSNSTQYNGMRQFDGMELNEMGMLPSFALCAQMRERPAVWQAVFVSDQ